MKSWTDLLYAGVIDGSAASATSALALMAAGRACGCGPYAPINAPSHWLWGDSGLRARELSLRHTLTGYAIHHASATLWGLAHARLAATRQPTTVLGIAARAATTAALACFVDYRLTPERLRPGFEDHLSRPALAVVYGALALGFAAPALLRRPRP